MQRGWAAAMIGGAVVASSLMVATRAVPSPGASGTDSGPLTIQVRKTTREMWLQDGERILRRFHIALGKEPTTTKLFRGDGRTPKGKYYVCEKRLNSRFRRFLAISYPNIDDAERALAEKLISADEWADIFFANLRQTKPPWNTLLGGQVGIHGYGGRQEIPIDWTEGCIAVSDSDIDYLYDAVPLGTPVVIQD